ncbi:MAG: hypothetical protein KBT36_11845 [Kurthia sp.]|nr:hypothetical protein [Candidatus Kurthia equi]
MKNANAISEAINILFPIVEPLKGFIKIEQLIKGADAVNLVGDSIYSQNAITIDFEDINDVPNSISNKLQVKIAEFFPGANVYYGDGHSFWVTLQNL